MDELLTPQREITWRHHVAIAALAMAIILFEVLVTRILSVTLSYHFAFLAISLAMLGLAAPGVWLSVAPPGPSALFRALFASAVALPLAMLFIVHAGAPLRQVISAWVLCLLAPMLALGTGVCILLLEAKGKRIARMYSADLGGAALGAILAVPLLMGLPTPAVVASLGILPLAALMLLTSRWRVIAGVLGVALAASVVWGDMYDLRYSRFYIETTKPLYERWTPTARITVFPQSWAQQFVGWGVGTRLQKAPADASLWIDQDGSAGTPILNYVPGTPFPEHLPYDVTAAPYELGLGPRACIIGGGGGKDILTALQAGARDVEVVELNPFTVDVVSKVFGDFSGNPYHLPGVSAFVGEGRSHFSRVTQPCDVLQISQIDTFAASSAGAYALTENSLYTVEALRSFWTRLTPEGVLSISRWVRGPAWPESARLVLLAVEALRREGVAEPRSHLVVLSAGGTANTLVFRSPVTAALMAKINQVAERRGFESLWPPQEGTLMQSPVTQVLLEGAGTFQAMGYDFSPSTDDRPFFFQTLSLLHGGESLTTGGTGEREGSVSLLRRLALIMASITIILFFLPLAFRGRLPRGPGLLRNTTYFAAIGVAFMFVEIPLLQRLTLYLGHPSYATTVVLGALLLGAGLGSSLAQRASDQRARLLALLVSLAVGVLCLSLTNLVVPATLFQSFMVRAMITIVFVGLSGVGMGLLLPLGMRHSDGRDRSWYWAINGASSVLASVLALVLALIGGFTLVLALAVAIYAVAAVTLPKPLPTE